MCGVTCQLLLGYYQVGLGDTEHSGIDSIPVNTDTNVDKFLKYGGSDINLKIVFNRCEWCL